MSTLTGILIAVFSVGGAATVTALSKGITGWRAGAARTEARAIQNIEKYRIEADERARQAEHRGSYQHDLAEYWRDRAGNAEYKIRTEWGADQIPPPGPLPVFEPLAPPTKAVTDHD